MLKIYVASSWRNEAQQGVVAQLRALGHQVYDFKNPPGRTGFSWKQCATEEQLKDPVTFRDIVLRTEEAQAGFKSDMDALAGADVTVLLLPCGRSAHLELGYATGRGQVTIVMLDTPMSEPELMYLMNDMVVTNPRELADAVTMADRVIVPARKDRWQVALSSSPALFFCRDGLGPSELAIEPRDFPAEKDGRIPASLGLRIRARGNVMGNVATLVDGGFMLDVDAASQLHKDIGTWIRVTKRIGEVSAPGEAGDELAPALRADR